MTEMEREHPQRAGMGERTGEERAAVVVRVWLQALRTVRERRRARPASEAGAPG